MYYVAAYPKRGGKKLWLMENGKFTPHSWKAIKLPAEYTELIVENLEAKYKTMRFMESY